MKSDSTKAILPILQKIVCEETNVIVPQELDWEKLWRFSVNNHFEVILYKYAKEEGCVPASINQEMASAYYSCVASSIRRNECLRQIESILQKERISYALQKGSILQNDYPEREMRFMSDIDIYINPADREKIHQCMVNHGFTYKGTESGDEQFVVHNTTGIEFHGRLLYRRAKIGIENYPAWEYVNENDNRLTEEGFALNLIGHAVGDLAKGGPGLRYILDLWIYRHRHSPQPDWKVVDKKLKDDGINEAAHNLLDLSEYLFSGLEPNDVLLEMTEYVFSGGLYGNTKRARATEVASAGGKKKAVLKQIVRTRSEYENRYPWVKKHPYLLPVAYAKRIGESLKKNRKVIARWNNGIKNVSQEEVLSQKERLQRWGL